MRKRLWQLHSWLGLAAGLGLLVIGLTGSVLVFHHEITRAVSPEVVLRESAPTAERLPLGPMVKRVEAAYPEFWVRGWLLYHEGPDRDIVYLTPHDDANAWYVQRVDPATGDISGPPVPRVETIYGWFVELHYTFFADHVGMGITAVFAIVFLLLSFTGLYLHRAFFKTVFRLRWGQSWRLITSDIHKAVGVLSIPLNFIFGFTGAYWNIAHLAEEWGHDHEGPDAWTTYENRLARIDELPARVEAEWPGYAFNYVYLPTAEDRQYYVFGQTPESHPFRSRYGSHLWFDADTLEVNHARDLRTVGAWARIVDAFEPLHFGDFGGLASKLIWCLAGFAPAALAISGSLIWFQRRRQTTKKRPCKTISRPQAQPETALAGADRDEPAQA